MDSDFYSLDISRNSMVYYPTTINNINTYAHETSSLTISSVTPSGTIRRITDDNSVIYKSGKDYYKHTNSDGSPAPITPAFKYGFYTFQGTTKDSTTGEFPIATIGLGFEVPYVDFDIEESIDLKKFGDPATITTSEKNAFYKTYKIAIPKGAPGSYIGDITQETTTTASAMYYDLSDVDPKTDALRKDITRPTVTPKSTSVLVGKYYYWDSTGDTPVVKKVQDNNNNDAKFLIANNHDIASVTLSITPAPTKTIDETTGEVTFTTGLNFGKFTVEYADGRETYASTLPLLAGLRVIKTPKGQFKLQAFYQQTGGGTLTPVDIGQAGPDY